MGHLDIIALPGPGVDLRRSSRTNMCPQMPSNRNVNPLENYSYEADATGKGIVCPFNLSGKNKQHMRIFQSQAHQHAFLTLNSFQFSCKVTSNGGRIDDASVY